VSPKALPLVVLFFLCGTLHAQISTTTQLTGISPAAPFFGQPVTLQATVVPASAPGTVSFMDGVDLVGIAPLDFSGHASFTTVTLAAGRHSLRAVYGGGSGGTYLPSQSASLLYIVTPVSGAGFALTSISLANLEPHGMAVGDFNADGKADVATANYGSNDVTVLLGNGTGGFPQPWVNYAVGTNPTSVAVGDFNGDGKADLVTTNNNSDNISVLLGNGNGTFLPASNYPAGDSPAFVVVGDFNGDAKADLAVVRYITFENFTEIRILLGSGNGSFPNKEVYEGWVATRARSVGIGDFNGDGKADLVVAVQYYKMFYVNQGFIQIFWGNGDGTFQFPTIANLFEYEILPYAVVVGDFNGDNNADIGLADYYNNRVFVCLGNGAGNCSGPSYSVGSNPYWLASGDFNGDGNIDLVTPNFGSNDQSVLLGNGNGTFQPAVNYPAGPSPAYVAVADFNGDGIADLADADFDADSNYVTVWAGTVPPATSTALLTSSNPSQFGQPVTLTAQLTPSNVTGRVEFLDGTTVLGIATISGGQAQMSTTQLAAGTRSLRARYEGAPGVWQPSLSGIVNQQVSPIPASGFTSASSPFIDYNPATVAVGDFNADGKADFVLGAYGGGTITALLGNGNGTFGVPWSEYTNAPNSVAVGDFNGDGKPDLAVASHPSDTLTVYLGNGNGTFGAAMPVTSGTGGPDFVAVGDVNGDGKADLALANYNNSTISLLLGSGNGTFRTALNYAVGTNPRWLVVGDFNADGKPDLASGNLGSNNISVLLGNGNGTFQQRVDYPAGDHVYAVATGDFNGDGKADLVAANYGSYNVSLFLGNGNGTFQPATNYPVGINPAALVVADLNGDGKPDVATADSNFDNVQNGDGVSLLLGKGDGTFQQPTLKYQADLGPFDLAPGDFNGDGTADLVVANFRSNNFSILFGRRLSLRFIPVTPCRLMDTRSGSGFSGPFGFPFISGNTSRTVPIPSGACGIPASAKAYSLNATVVPQGFLDYLTLWPTGFPKPFVSTVNAYDGQITANAAIVPAGAGGSIDMYASNNTDVILDINGYFLETTSNSALVFYPVTPCRILDTRNTNGTFGGPILSGGITRSFPIPSSSCGIPATAQAYAFNATVVPSGFLDYLTLWPAGAARPFVSTLNAYDGQVTANMAIVPAGTAGAINAFATQNTHLIIDVTGYFAPPGLGGLQFTPVTPCRVVDTRNPNGPFGGPILGGGTSRSFAVPSSSCSVPASAQAYSMNATVVPSGFLDYLTVWPTGGAQPFVSTLNAYDAQVTANALIVPAGTAGAASAFATNTTHLILDIGGYFAP
jgi:Big-like domain-containing protein/VCBS repeat protein/FG-GAP repeat protein